MTNHVFALLAEPTLGQLIKQVISIVIIGAIFFSFVGRSLFLLPSQRPDMYHTTRNINIQT